MSSSNPFEDEGGAYKALVNAEGQHSLWPSFILALDGWEEAGTEG